MSVLRGILAPLPVVAVVAAVLLLTAGLAGGVWVWPTAWVFLAVFGGVSALASGLLAVLAPASFAVRQQAIVAEPAKKQPLIDALGLLFYTGCILAWLAFIPLDVFRLKLAPPPGQAVQGLGVALMVAGLAIAYAAIGQNRFAAPTIHDQSAEGQQVIQTGLYGLVRHPFYAGMLLVYVGVGLWLGSYAAAALAVGFLIMTLARIVIEERYLREHLAGYGDYARRVRGRLIPYLL
ncbi:protein-S-isoprenylcysteine O-methyltransferase Ste14 [Caulobacter ginsengisoli]|uniref:Protein-S-isoprenylcysteine O-methyltransferase Ste14 n=1 Tax=Caulobacter ginsengisoli TaxID=400775 RepID=A0ABU0IQ73_9CAUL|nr:isoprenylcysteine carboxylmethyltransferase family protein [Caulobacter ginsengisoli]MDQ0464156.1 protein-S-isoprenylcysteine O-methyltransferase Ste14 [Caulobacter ginsengisoli]